MSQRNWFYLIAICFICLLSSWRLTNLAISRNELGLCWINNPKPEKNCEEKLAHIIELGDSNPKAKYTAARFLGLAAKEESVISLLSTENHDHLDFLSAYALLIAYKNLGYTDKALSLIEAAQIPNKMIVTWALDANNQKKIEEASIWLLLADSFGPSLGWSSRRWLGFLWWDIYQDVEKALIYLEPVHKEIPTAIYPIRLLGQIYRANNQVGQSIEILEDAYILAPDDLFILRELIVSLSLRATPVDIIKVRDLTKIALPLLDTYLREYPESDTLIQWQSDLLINQR